MTTTTTEQSYERRPQRVRYEFLLEAQTPVAHHQETIGNESIFMRKKVRRHGGWEYVPYITGGAMRNRMRRAATLALLDAAGMRADAFSLDGIRLLFNGGALRGGDGGAYRVDVYRELCELVPPLGLFGGCAGGQINSSRLITEDATLVCRETGDRHVEPWMVEAAIERWGALETHSAHVESTQRVRGDATKDPVLQRLLTADATVEMNRRLLARQKASDDDDAVEKEKEKGGMMPRTMEVVAQGSLFAWTCEADVATPLERDTFDVAALAFLADARVGGKVNSDGCGRLRVVAANEVRIGDPLRELEKMDTKALAPRVGQLFRAHVNERKERIKSFVEQVVA